MGKTIEYYLSRGYDLKAAEYFTNGIKKIVSVMPNDDYTLSITFDNGETRLYDVKPLIEKGTVFEPLENIEMFRRVYVDKYHCIAWDIDPNVDSEKVWNNKIDLHYDNCYMDSTPIGGTK